MRSLCFHFLKQCLVVSSSPSAACPSLTHCRQQSLFVGTWPGTLDEVLSFGEIPVSSGTVGSGCPVGPRLILKLGFPGPVGVPGAVWFKSLLLFP